MKGLSGLLCVPRRRSAISITQPQSWAPRTSNAAIYRRCPQALSYKAITAALPVPPLPSSGPPKDALILDYKQLGPVMLPTTVHPHDNLCMELRLATYQQESPLPIQSRRSGTNPIRGVLKIHGLWAACTMLFYGAHFRNTSGSYMYPQKQDFKRASKQCELDICKQLGGQEVADLETIWFEPTLPATEFWASQCAKHVNYHLGFAIPDYFRTVYDLALPFFNGKELDIRRILQEAGFNVGEYHNIKDFQMVLKKALGVDVNLTFKLHQGHPILAEIGIMFDMSGNLINHPSAAQVPEGKFLFHTTPM